MFEEKYGLKVKRERFNIYFTLLSDQTGRKMVTDKGILSGKN
jgi:hypothetical protein